MPVLPDPRSNFEGEQPRLGWIGGKWMFHRTNTYK